MIKHLLNHATMLLMSNKYTPSTRCTSFMHLYARLSSFSGYWLAIYSPKSMSWYWNTILWLEVAGPSLEAHIGSGVFQMGRRQCHTKAIKSP